MIVTDSVADVATPISHLISLEVFDLVETPSGFGMVATMRHGAMIAMLRMEAVIDVSMKAFGAVKPRPSAYKDAA